MEFQASGSRRQFLSAVAMTAGAAILLRSRLGWAADKTDPRVADIVAKTIGIDTHNHIDVPLTAAETPGPNIELEGFFTEVFEPAADRSAVRPSASSEMIGRALAAGPRYGLELLPPE